MQMKIRYFFHDIHNTSFSAITFQINSIKSKCSLIYIASVSVNKFLIPVGIKT